MINLVLRKTDKVVEKGDLWIIFLNNTLLFSKITNNYRRVRVRELQEQEFPKIKHRSSWRTSEWYIINPQLKETATNWRKRLQFTNSCDSPNFFHNTIRTRSRFPIITNSSRNTWLEMPSNISSRNEKAVVESLNPNSSSSSNERLPTSHPRDVSPGPVRRLSSVITSRRTADFDEWYRRDPLKILKSNHDDVFPRARGIHIGWTYTSRALHWNLTDQIEAQLSFCTMPVCAH